MQELILDNGIKEIAVKKENGDLITVLKINVADGRTAEKFAQLIDRLNKITDEQNEQKKAMDAKYTGRKIVYNGGESVDTEQVIDRSRMNVSYLEKCIEELDLVFGQGTVRNVYRENYEMDEYFIPDEAALVEFVDKLIPVMTELFGQRFQSVKSRYNARNRGKNSKYNKRTMIQGYKHE